MQSMACLRRCIFGFVVLLALHLVGKVNAQGPEVELNISSRTPDVESDNTAVYYPSDSDDDPLLLGNDGSAATGGFRIWELDSDSPLEEEARKLTGRSKLVTTLYDIGGMDIILTISQPDSIFRVFEVDDVNELTGARKHFLGDWSALCPWRSRRTGEQYVYLFGKKRAVQFLVRKGRDGIQILEVQTFTTPVEASSCAVSQLTGTMYFAAEEDKHVYYFELSESTAPPEISVTGEAEDDVSGLAVYSGTSSDYLFVAQGDTITVVSESLSPIGSITLVGAEDIEAQGLSVYQAPFDDFSAGALAYALETDDGKYFGISSLEEVLEPLGLEINTRFNPRKDSCSTCTSTVCSKCSKNGYCTSGSSGGPCSCFAGFTGSTCAQLTCKNNCSGRGTCIGPNTCKCTSPWGGPDCSFLLVQPKAETDATPGDGDDPAIWIAPGSRAQSRIITTTKTDEGAGLSVFDLTGKKLQSFAAEEPNNVDVIYGFEAGGKSIDLAYAACRGDNTLCLFQITPTGQLQAIEGGIQPTEPDFEVYGSCPYTSPTTNKTYLFVNSKTSEYLQYELTSSPTGALRTTLVRSFFAGTGGQVEGCVADNENGVVFIGEEPFGLWRYGAEPDSFAPGVIVDSVRNNNLEADVEGVTLIQGKTKDKGFIIVSSQGVSKFNVYRRAAPHEFVLSFTVTGSRDGRIDKVTNTDGIAAVGTNLGSNFPNGLIVVHDDANELPGGAGTSADASFKLVSLLDVLGNDAVRTLGLLKDVDSEWNPRDT